jgi:hypothetical protein
VPSNGIAPSLSLSVKYVFSFLPSFLFLFSQDLPADSTDAGFETQSANDLFEQYVLPAGAGQNALHLNFVGVLNVVTL